MSKVTNKCEGRVFIFHSSVACGAGARYEHNGHWYCKRHHPPTLDAKREARAQEWEARWQARNAAYEAARKEKAAQEHRAACFDDLLAVVEAIEAALKMGIPASEVLAPSSIIREQMRATIDKARKQ